MRLAVLGLTLSSSWGNGHATTYRALLRAFAARGHEVLFLERDEPWYAAHRDLADPEFCELILYRDREALAGLRERLTAADVVLVGSYVQEGVALGRWLINLRRGATAFYDIDTPVTLAQLQRGACDYLSYDLIRAYDLYLSFTGGPTLQILERQFGSPAARALYCTVDTNMHRPLEMAPEYDLGYLGTYSDDRQPALERLLIEPARHAPERRFIVAGPQYPANIDWPANVTRVEHVGPRDHAAFYASSRFTLNITRADMIRAGYSPSVRLFEAAACGAAIISDRWRGFEDVLVPGREALLADDCEAVLSALAMGEPARNALRNAARRRILQDHAADQRAAQLETYLTSLGSPSPAALTATARNFAAFEDVSQARSAEA